MPTGHQGQRDSLAVVGVDDAARVAYHCISLRADERVGPVLDVAVGPELKERLRCDYLVEDGVPPDEIPELLLRSSAGWRRPLVESRTDADPVLREPDDPDPVTAPPQMYGVQVALRIAAVREGMRPLVTEQTVGHALELAPDGRRLKSVSQLPPLRGMSAATGQQPVAPRTVDAPARPDDVTVSGCAVKPFHLMPVRSRGDLYVAHSGGVDESYSSTPSDGRAHRILRFGADDLHVEEHAAEPLLVGRKIVEIVRRIRVGIDGPLGGVAEV